MQDFKLIENEIEKNITEIDESKLIANKRYLDILSQKIVELASELRGSYGYTSVHIRYS